VHRIEGVLGGVDYHQFYVLADEPGAYPDAYPTGGPPNRLLATTGSREAVCVTTGIAMGVVRLGIELLDAPPLRLDGSREWEAVEEASFEAFTPRARVVLLMSAAEPPFDDFPLPTGPGWYRVRGHATGRSVDFDSVVTDNPHEEHLLQVWPADGFEPSTELRADDPWANQHYAPDPAQG